MEEKLFLMTEQSFKETMSFFSKQDQVDKEDREQLYDYLEKVLNPQFPFKFDFILQNKQVLSNILIKLNYQVSKKSIFKSLEINAIKKYNFKQAYKISRVRRFMSSLKSKYYVSNIFSEKVKNIVIYESFNGKSFSDSPKMIYNELSKRRADYRHVVVTNNEKLKNTLSKQGIETVDKNTKAYFKLYNQSKVWIANTRISPQVYKKKSQIFIQTWHGTPLKKLANDQTVISIPEVTLEEYLYGFNKETSRWDYLLSPSKTATSRFKTAFNLPESHILTLGYPRNDDLINYNNSIHIKQLKEKHNVPFNKKVILYAPTWRDNDRVDIGQYNFKLKLDLDYFEENLSDDYILIIRAHYLVSNALNLESYNSVYDLSKAEDINELFLISDILITDYSSVYFDFANLERPILFFAYDKESYANDIRGFYVPYESDLPGPIFSNSHKLFSFIKNENYQAIPNSQQYKQFNKVYNELDDGKATSRVVDRIIQIL